ncbi:hypothetical protein HOP50_03g23560 [Chloropicon primus]|uniref:Uncharacterized protein n=1 Tax=Chloropicon primus TaxID=1764295 RepID=A0A5B8MKD2_9CHLO|nr:hypothetical protein A3770_03p23580 [Chloropicon primus]UPQ99050.1 hypothetical protein HOP50_03g23560 [Chloropicon primus]|eukprot:QDZ19840.1 hypothetical protein A3770_03p23580 [Chloropicon primus]
MSRGLFLVLVAACVLSFVEAGKSPILDIQDEGESILDQWREKAANELESERERQSSFFGFLRTSRSCWPRALSDTKRACASRTEKDLTRLALAFTSCHLREGGLRYPCDVETDVDACVKRVGKRGGNAFAAYTQFRIHVYTVCFSLEARSFEDYTKSISEALLERAAESLALGKQLSHGLHGLQAPLSEMYNISKLTFGNTKLVLQNERDLLRTQDEVRGRVQSLSSVVLDQQNATEEFFLKLQMDSAQLLRMQEEYAAKVEMVGSVYGQMRQHWVALLLAFSFLLMLGGRQNLRLAAMMVIFHQFVVLGGTGTHSIEMLFASLSVLALTFHSPRDVASPVVSPMDLGPLRSEIKEILGLLQQAKASAHHVLESTEVKERSKRAITRSTPTRKKKRTTRSANAKV